MDEQHGGKVIGCAIETFEFLRILLVPVPESLYGRNLVALVTKVYVYILDNDAPVRQLRGWHRCSNPRHLCAPPLYPRLFCRPRPNVKVWQITRHEG